MPKAAKHSTLLRQWEMMQLLTHQRPGKTSTEIHRQLAERGYGVSRRTVERDLMELRDAFPALECNDLSKPYGWYWEKNAALTIPGMSIDEAMSLGLLGDLLQQVMPPAFYALLQRRIDEGRKLLGQLPDNACSGWPGLVRYLPEMPFFRPPEVNEDILGAVQEALTKGRRLLVEYTRAGQVDSFEVVLHPLALIQQGMRPYLLANADHREHESEPYRYALQRMQSAEAMPDRRTIPDGFSLDDHLASTGGQVGTGGVLKVKARVGYDLARILEETPLSEDQRITTWRGEERLTATVADSWNLRYWILSQGADFVVTEPRALRREIAGRIEKAREEYRK